jgi:hypothetical protein
MNVLGALLALLNVVTIVGPVAGVALVYQNNLQEMVITPQIQDILNGGTGNGNGGLSSAQEITMPQFVSETTDLADRSITIVLNFTNPFNYDLMVNSVSADIVASQDNFTLGRASLDHPTNLPANQTSNIVILCQWTLDDENHFSTSYPGASTIDVDVVGITVNVNDITIQAPTSYHIPNVPIG